MKAFDIVVHILNHYYLPAISAEFSKQQGCEQRISECLSGPLKLTSFSGPDMTSQHQPARAEEMFQQHFGTCCHSWGCSVQGCELDFGDVVDPFQGIIIRIFCYSVMIYEC